MSREKVKIVEVGPRDGLQNEKKVLSLETKVQFVSRLADIGLRTIELGAFVSPKWVPQMAGSHDVVISALKDISARPQAYQFDLSALVPNERGLEEALATGVRHVAIFASATETFSQKNINCSIDESFKRFAGVMSLAKAKNIRVRGYLSMCFGCAFEGDVPVAKVVSLTERLLELGVEEVSVGDTIGAADPRQVREVIHALAGSVKLSQLAMHFHDTRGTAIANVLASLDLGIRTFDASLGGLGGCPYAPSATGNVATEDVAYMLEKMGLDTGVDLDAIPALTKWIASEIGHDLPSKFGKAGWPKGVSR